MYQRHEEADQISLKEEKIHSLEELEEKLDNTQFPSVKLWKEEGQTLMAPKMTHGCAKTIQGCAKTIQGCARTTKGVPGRPRDVPGPYIGPITE